MGLLSRLGNRLSDAFSVLIEGRSAVNDGAGYNSALFGLWLSGVDTTCDVLEIARSLGIKQALVEEGLRNADTLLLEQSSTAFPSWYATERGTLAMLYALVRDRRPRCVVETGVANGLSTRIILRALAHNEFGTLVSFDVEPTASETVDKVAYSSYWRFELLPRSCTVDNIQERLESCSGSIDLWYHDSDHSYGWQIGECRLAWKMLSRRGLLVVDDVDGNSAFADFARENRASHFLALFERRKVSGFATVT